MKRLKFKWTLSKKIFLWVLLSFCVINIINLQLNVESEKSNVYQQIQTNDDALFKISKNFYRNYMTIEDSNFLESLRKNNHPYLHLYDKDFKAVDKKSYMNNDYNLPTLLLTDNKDDLNYIVSLENIDLKEFQEVLEGKNLSELNNHVLLAYDNSKDVSKEFFNNEETGKVFEVKDILYLKVGNFELVPKKSKSLEIHELNINDYTRDTFGFITTYSGEKAGVDFIKQRDICMDQLLKDSGIAEENIYSKNIEAGTQYGLHIAYGTNFESNESLYSSQIFPLVKKGAKSNSDGYVSKDDVMGYIMTYNMSPHCITDIQNRYIRDNGVVYFISFVFAVLISLILSYMLTKRIKTMNAATKKIASNDFNVHLEELPNDELGDLSQNINTMSTNLKETMKELTHEIEHVKKLESVRKEFIANFTHEIKTPLGIINGYIELMEETKDEQKKRQYLNAVNKETDRINELVLAMLNLSKLESENVELNIQDIDIEDLITSTIDSFVSLLKKKQIKIKLQGQSVLIQADLFQIQLVLKNIISNAIKHTPEQGYIYITIKDDRVLIENEGSYLTPQQQKNIWDTYVSSDREGTGLGLAICKTILDLHQFKYQVENTDKGVCFTIRTRKEEN